MAEATDIHGPETPDEESLAFEALTVTRVTGSVAAGLDELVTAILAAFEAVRATFGELSDAEAKEFGKALARRIEALMWEPMRPALNESARDAHRLGVDRAARRFPAPADKAKASRTKTPAGRKTIPIDANLRSDLRTAARVARSGVKTETDAAAVAGKVKAAKARSQGAARWTANEGINAGTAAVARTMDMRLVWVAERNACLHCLAHAGYVVKPGDLFPALSFDPEAKGVSVVEFPPLHPNCRCQIRTTDAPAGPAPTDRSSLNPAAALAREARRSVVYQWTDHASNPAMMRAADALLSAGADLPASVEERARRKLRAQRRRQK